MDEACGRQDAIGAEVRGGRDRASSRSTVLTPGGNEVVGWELRRLQVT